MAALAAFQMLVLRSQHLRKSAPRAFVLAMRACECTLTTRTGFAAPGTRQLTGFVLRRRLNRLRSVSFRTPDDISAMRTGKPGLPFWRLAVYVPLPFPAASRTRQRVSGIMPIQLIPTAEAPGLLRQRTRTFRPRSGSAAGRTRKTPGSRLLDFSGLKLPAAYRAMDNGSTLVARDFSTEGAMKRQHILTACKKPQANLVDEVIVVDALPIQHIQPANTPRSNSRRGHVRLRLSQPP